MEKNPLRALEEGTGSWEGMTRGVAGGSMGARILMLLGERYPIHLRDVALALGARPDVISREARKLQGLGLVTLEPLGRDTFVALTGSGITYLGLPPKEAARLRARKLPPGRPRDDEDPAFG